MTLFLFSQINDSYVLLRKNGTFKEAQLFERNGTLFAKYGSGFIKLKTDDYTSVDKLYWSGMTLHVGRVVPLDHGYLGWTDEPIVANTRKRRRKAA